MVAGAGDATSCVAVSPEGKLVNEEGSSAGLGNKLDLLLLVSLRNRCHVVATSTATANADQYRLPTRAQLIVFGNRTKLRSPRIVSGEHRLTLVGIANANHEVPYTRHIDALSLDRQAILTALRPASQQNIERIQFEFGAEGLAALSYQLSDFFCTSLAMEVAVNFVDNLLPGMRVVTQIGLDDLNLSWWQRRGKE